MACWFMPQYPRAGYGALFAGDAATRYFVGQGNYQDGNVILQKTGIPGVPGDPVLTVMAGAAAVRYLAPTFKPGVWQHIAVVRKSATLSLYLNGTLLKPVQITPQKNSAGEVISKTVFQTSELQIAPSVSGSSLGTLVLGQANHPTNTANAQAYGLLDDVAVFAKALSATELSALAAKKRLSGYENGLLAGWGFDAPEAGKSLPAKLAGPIKTIHVAGPVKVSSDRKSDSDKGLLDFIAVFPQVTPYVRLPFPPGEEWKVS